MPRLVVIKGPDEGKQFELAEPVVALGRDAASRIRLHDTEVSRRHAEFRLINGGWTLMDVGSANGTFVNNQRSKQAKLQGGDRITMGQTTLVFSAGQGGRIEPATDLAKQISLITRADLELSSAIVKTIGEGEGSRILAHPDKNSPWVQNALANLAIMYEASQAVSNILDLTELLNRLLEVVFRSITADRGCFMVQQGEANTLQPHAVRWRKENVKQEKFPISKTIMEHVLQNREGVLIADAAKDDRFGDQDSIVKLGVREVLCVPMKGRHETLGVLYLDTNPSVREMAAEPGGPRRFGEDHLHLASAVAHQAALAVEETRYHQALLQGERLAAIGQTIAALSHHIKNILQGLRSGSEILKMGLKDKNDHLIQQGWRVAEKNQAKIYDLVMDMLSYSKERVPAVELVDLNEITREIHELMASRAGELNVKIEMNLAENLPRVLADPDGIHRALLNIVSNGLDAAEGKEEAKVTLATRVGDDGWIRLIVLDNGHGIAADKIPDLFTPFISTKGAKGTGLGLVVSRKILREHGGDIVVTSQEGVGSKFTLRLPLKSPLAVDPSTTSGEMPILPPEEE